MGQCTQASYAYGFILHELELLKLLAAHRSQNSSGDPKDEKSVQDRRDQSGLQYNDKLNELENILEEFARGVDIEPYTFTVYGHQTEAHESMGEVEIAFLYNGNDEYEESIVLSVDIWGSDNYGHSFISSSTPPFTDPDFLKEANEAIKKVKETSLFKEAGVTDIVPQWILVVSLT